MIKQVGKHFSYDVSALENKLYSLTYRDFLIFRKKFYGIFIFRGKKSFSIKFLHYILLNLKKLQRKVNPMQIFFIIAKRITPFLTIGQRKFGKNIIAVPSFFFGNKKNVLILRWIVRLMKNKSNIYGIKKEDVLKNLIDIYKFRGSVLKLKEEHNKKVRLTRINFKNEGINVNDFAVRKWDKEKFIQAKYDYWWEEIDRLNEDLQLSDDEIQDEIERWQMVEKDYKYIKRFDRSIERLKKKNEEFIYNYKKLFVK
jgi:ribosomal protein S7